MKKLLIANIIAIITACILIITLIIRSTSLPEQTVAERFNTANIAPYGQVSLYYAAGNGISRSECYQKSFDIAEKTKSLVKGIGGETVAFSASAAPKNLAFSSRSDIGSKSANLQSFFVGGDFFLFHPYELLSGTYLSDDTIMRDNAVIDENAAWQLFGSNDVVGEYIFCGSTAVHISGVVKTFSGSSDTSNPGFIYLDSELSMPITGAETAYTTFEIVLPSPVTGAGLTTVKETAGLSDSDVNLDKTVRAVDNTARERIGNLFAILRDIPALAVKDDAIILPSWENIARKHAVQSAFVLLVLCAVLVVPLVSIIILIVLFVKSKSKIWAKIKKTAAKIAKKFTSKKNIAALTCLCLCFLGSCGNTAGIINNNTTDSISNTSITEYRAVEISSGGNAESDSYKRIIGADVKDDMLYLLAEKFIPDGEQLKFTVDIIKMDLTGAELKKRRLSENGNDIDTVVNYSGIMFNEHNELVSVKTMASRTEVQNNRTEGVIEEILFNTDDLSEEVTGTLDQQSIPVKYPKGIYLRAENTGSYTDIMPVGMADIKPDFIFAVSNNRYVIIGYDEAENSHIYVVTPAETVSGGISVTFAAPFASDYIADAITAFNAENDKYRVVYKTYYTDADPEADVLQAMNLDIAAGFVPDMISASLGLYYTYKNKDLLMDMMPFINADPELKANLVESVLEAQTENGKLYSVSPFFAVSALAGKTSVWGDKKELSIDDLKTYKGKTSPSLFPATMIRRNFLSDCLYSKASSFMDFENNVCHFDTPEFIALLEYAKSLPVSYPADFSDIYEEERLKSGDTLLESRMITSFRDLVGLEKVIFGEPVTFLNYPAYANSSGSEPIISAQLAAGETAIMENADHPDGAWAFTKFLLTDPAAIPKDNDIFAIYKPTLEKRAEEAKTASLINRATYGVNMTEIPPNTDADNAKIYALIDSVNHIARVESALITIISDDINSFFSGDKSAAETAAMIQNRVTTYMSENA
jgi:ABC-type glycerol-3-phosphate transport system substrate-binding protein